MFFFSFNYFLQLYRLYRMVGSAMCSQFTRDKTLQITESKSIYTMKLVYIRNQNPR